MVPPSTGLPQAAWSAEADVGAERRNPVPLSQKSRCLAGRRPADGTMSHIESDGGSESKRRGGCRVDSCGHAATGERPGIDEASEPWRVALQAGPGAFTSSGRADGPQRWQARRAKTVLAATVGHRHARAAALDGKRQGVKGTLAAPAAAPPVSRKRGDGSPITTQLPHARPGAALRPRGAVDHASPRLARALGLRPPRTLRCSLSIRARRRRRGSRDELRDRRAEAAPAQRAQVLVG